MTQPSSPWDGCDAHGRQCPATYDGGMTAHRISLGAINIEASDPAALARFWGSVTGGAPGAGDDAVYLPAAGPDGFAMFFHRGDVDRGPRQVSHLDLTVPWGSRRSEVERIVGLGATYQWDVLDEVPHVQWTTLTDPEGNLFCVAEHPPADRG